MHGRLPWFRPDELDSHQHELYQSITTGARAQGPQSFRLTDDEGRLEGPFNAMLVNSQIGDAIAAVGTAVRYHSNLTDRCREIAILTAAAVLRSDFEWYAHERVGRRIGLSEDDLEALRELGGGDGWPPEEQVTRSTVISLLTEGDLPDDDFDRAASILGTVRLAELVSLVGYYRMLALSLRVWRTPLPAGEQAVF